MIRNFLLQLVWLLFAECCAMIDGRPTEATSSCWTTRTTTDATGALHGTTYVNGELFAHRALVHLTKDEARSLYDIAGFDWRQVDPTIFGSLLERFLGKDSRSNLGIHYTHEADIGRSSGPRPRSVAQDSDEIVRRLLALNQEIASGVRPYDPFGASRTTGLPSPSSNSEEQESGATYVAQI